MKMNFVYFSWLLLKANIQHECYKYKVTGECCFATELSLHFQMAALFLYWSRCLTE